MVKFPRRMRERWSRNRRVENWGVGRGEKQMHNKEDISSLGLIYWPYSVHSIKRGEEEKEKPLYSR